MSSPTSLARSHPASKRELILDAAFALIGEKGYRGLSFQELADRCALTKQGILHYFPSKPTLLRSLLDERDASIESFLLDHLAREGFEIKKHPGEKRAILKDGLVSVVAHMAETPGLIRLHVVLRAEAIAANHPAADYFRERDRATLEWLVARTAELTATPGPTARHVLAVMLGLQQQWLQEDHAFDLVVEWRRALDKLLAN